MKIKVREWKALTKVQQIALISNAANKKGALRK